MKAHQWKLLMKHTCGQEQTVLDFMFSVNKITLRLVCVLCGEETLKDLPYNYLIAKAGVADYVDAHPDLLELALLPERRVN